MVFSEGIQIEHFFNMGFRKKKKKKKLWRTAIFFVIAEVICVIKSLFPYMVLKYDLASDGE